ncbi:retrovirus-related Pol polyprotein from transposon 297 [Trichonephila clavipes]|nr:retrovirus-related Pol polyprotein from transposon 297 [Trichonephila clavipes]
MQKARDLLFEIGQARFISVLDLTKGYWQIPMKDEAKPLTAFVTHPGHYQWKDEHLNHFAKVFKSLQEVVLKVNLKKCAFGRKSVKFLGHIVGSGKPSPDPEKVETIRKLSRPTTKSEVRSLLGLVSYYRDYIPNFSLLVLPLTNLTKKNIPKDIPWESSAEDSFVKLKEELEIMPSLHTPDLSRPFLLFTDASTTTIGAYLAQHNDHTEEMPIAFFSKKLTLSQMKWSTIECEAFCVLEALRKLETWIFVSQIQVISDYDLLTYLTNSAPHGVKLTRWALALQRYNVKVSYRKGSAHGNADALSRLRISDKDVTRLPPPDYHPSLAYLIPRFVTNRAYLGSFGTANWIAYEFGRTGGAFSTTVERDDLRHHIELACLNA